jgi:hypothetical protein
MAYPGCGAVFLFAYDKLKMKAKIVQPGSRKTSHILL